MRIEKDCIKDIPLRRRPHGYVFICCNGINKTYPTYFGEVQVIANYTPVYFRYTIDYLDMVKRYYCITIFQDREFEKVVSKVHVEFIDEDSRKIKLSPEITGCFVPDEIYSFMHMVIYERIIQQVMPQIQLVKLHCSPEQARNGFHLTFGFRNDVIEDFFEETYVKFEDFVSTLKPTLEE